MAAILDTLRRAIREGDKSRYRLAQESGLAESALSRLMSGERGLSIEAAEKLAAALELVITIGPAAGQKTGKSKTKGR
jgi:transcriptional regulator with XRE-family HTH domain